VEWLLDRGGVAGRWCRVHATPVTDSERRGIAARGAVAGLCPITEANLGDGVFPAAAFVAEGGRFGVGSDSNVRIDAAEELRLLEYGQRLTGRARNLLAAEPGASTGGALYRGALAGGAAALGQGLAGLAVGASTDFVALDAEQLDLAGRSGDALLDGHVFGGGGWPKAVWRAGRQVVADGRHVGREAIAARYRRTLERLLA
jgi:formimidoylglutamate deiminase